MTREAQGVLEEHLENVDAGEIEKDIRENFSDDCVLLTTYGRFTGHEGVKQAASLLERQLPNADFEYMQKTASGPIAFLEWTGRGGGKEVDDGADSFLVQDGRIRVMTIHYTVKNRAPGEGTYSP